MNINLKAKRILCYGDSNTWGCMPLVGGRYPANIRWTTLLQKYLGNKYEIIEEGLNNRTTEIDDSNVSGVNGLSYLKPCLKSHNPLDLVIIMLGSNDMKKAYSKIPKEIAKSMEKLIKEILPIKIILLSPPLIDESVDSIKFMFDGAEAKSKQIGNLYQKIAKKHKLNFLNVAKIVKPSKKDGGHLDPESHKTIAEELEKLVIEVV